MSGAGARRIPTARSPWDPPGEVVLQRNRAGHFLADGEVNGRRVTFLLDTGATYIALPAQIARELKLKLGPPITLQTAAGPATGYPTRLESVRLAGIEMRDMAAVVAEGPRARDRCCSA